MLYDLKGSNFAQRIAGIFGSNFNQRLYHVEEDTDVVKIYGYVGKSEYVKRSRGEQYIFVNGRFIKHPGLSAAIERAYSELIPERTYPSYFILLEVDPQRIDINIPPTKTEVRFIDEQVIFAILRAATKKALGQFSLANELEFNPSTVIDFTPAKSGFTPEAPKVSYNPQYNPFNSDGGGHNGGTSRIHPSRTGDADSTPGHDDYANFFNTKVSAAPHQSSGTLIHPSEGDAEVAVVSTAATMPINYQNRYIITTMKSGIVVIDQQRASERIMFERLMSRFNTGEARAQQLLFPVNCRFNTADSELPPWDVADRQRAAWRDTARPTPGGLHHRTVRAEHIRSVGDTSRRKRQ